MNRTQLTNEYAVLQQQLKNDGFELLPSIRPTPQVPLPTLIISCVYLVR